MDYVHYCGILQSLFLLTMLQGLMNVTLGQPCSCSGYGDCNFTQICLPKDNCTKENVALGKSANMSSVWNSSVSACLAVNGNTITSFYTRGDGKSNCVKSSATENNSSWTVDLGQNYTITNITLYTEKSYPQVTEHLQVTVDGNPCFQFEFSYDGQERENTRCTEPVNGRNVKFYSPRNFYIFFCEVQVWVCKAGFYGDDCDHVCHCQDNDKCDNYYGTCTTACINGYYGHNCSLLCGHCLQGQCDKINGSCLNGCEAGWMNTTCVEECKPGYYGPNCNTSCGNCANNAICNKTIGTCPGGCDNGWKPPNCKQTCDNGTYGPNCSSTCGSCTNDEPCDKVNGACNLCKPGWIPILCREGVASENSGNTVGAIVGSILGGFAILGIIIAVTLVIYLRRFKGRSSDSRTKPSTELQPTSDKSASIKSPTNAEQGNVESANVYDEIENHYNSLHPMDQREQHTYILPAFEERNARPAKDNRVYVNTITS